MGRPAHNRALPTSPSAKKAVSACAVTSGSMSQNLQLPIHHGRDGGPARESPPCRLSLAAWRPPRHAQVPRAGQDEQARVGQPGGEPAAVLNRDDLVLVAVHDERRHADPRQVGLGVVRLDGLELRHCARPRTQHPRHARCGDA